MVTEKGDFIKLSYTGKFDGGKVFDTTDEELAKKEEIYNPRGMYGGDIVIVGAGHTIQGLDEELIGKEVGSSGTVVIPPEKAFGEHDPKLVETVSISKFKDRHAEVGMQIEVEGKRGVVSKVIGRRVRVDFNHPLAGKEITYDYTIEETIEDSMGKIQGLLTLYTGMPDLEIELEDKKARIIIPVALTFNQRWLMSKGRIASEVIENTDVEEIEYVEKYPVEAPVQPEAEEAVEETAEEAEASEE